MHIRLLLVSVVLLISGCEKGMDNQKVKIALNPWPGYEFIYLAQEKGFFKEVGLNIQVVEKSSLADVQRVFIQGRAEGFASTMIEVVQVVGTLNKPVTVFHIADFSDGGDIIMARHNITSVKDLKGKKVGAEIGSLGMYILALALNKHGLELSDVDFINVEQLDAKSHMASGQIDAMVTYPPFSTEIEALGGMKNIFSTREIPGEVIDTISINTEELASLPRDWLDRFYQAWDRTLLYAQEHPDEAHPIMAEREGISVDEFREALTGLKIFSSVESRETKKSPAVRANLNKVCETLVYAGAKNLDCSRVSELVQFR